MDFSARKKCPPRRAASLGDLYAPKRIFSCNTASKCHSRRQPCRGILSCLAEKSLTLECFAVLKVRFFSYRKTQRTKKYWMYFKDDRLSVRKKILSKPCKSLSESAQWPPAFALSPVFRCKKMGGRLRICAPFFPFPASFFLAGGACPPGKAEAQDPAARFAQQKALLPRKKDRSADMEHFSGGAFLSENGRQLPILRFQSPLWAEQGPAFLS